MTATRNLPGPIRGWVRCAASAVGNVAILDTFSREQRAQALSQVIEFTESLRADLLAGIEPAHARSPMIGSPNSGAHLRVNDLQRRYVTTLKAAVCGDKAAIEALPEVAAEYGAAALNPEEIVGAVCAEIAES